MKKVVLISAFASTLLLSAGGRASAQVVDFATCDPNMPLCVGAVNDCCHRAFEPVALNKPIIIPMDRCHQNVGTGPLAPPSSASPKWCSDSESADDGMYQAYGLVYRLMQKGIPVYWVVNPTKDPPALTSSQNHASQVYNERDIDFWVTSRAAVGPLAPGNALANTNAANPPPVLRLNPATLAAVAGSYTKQQFPVRGGAFVIAAEDRPAFNLFWNSPGQYTAYTGSPKTDFAKVDMYEIQGSDTVLFQDYRDPPGSYAVTRGLPVAVRIDYAPPRLARLSPAGVSNIWLTMAKLDEPANNTCKAGGVFNPPTAVFCDITETDIQAGRLTQGSFQWAWIDNWSDNSPCGNAAEQTQFDKVDEFLTHVPGVRSGGHVLFQEAVIDVAEGCNNSELLGVPGVGLTTSNLGAGEPLIIRYASNIFVQWGDLPTEFANGSVGKWQYYGGGALGYAASMTGSLVRLVTEDRAATGNALCTNHKSAPGCDVFANNADADLVDVGAYARHRNDPENGIVFYLPGNQVNNAPSHLRMVLNALIAVPTGTVPQLPTLIEKEVSRSSPIVATVDGISAQYQGTYVVKKPADPTTVFSNVDTDTQFQFPHTLGHLRAIDTSAITSTATEFNALGSVVFDAATGIPAPTAAGCGAWFTPGCRTVFTNTVSGLKPDKIFMSTTNVAQLQPLMAPGIPQTAAELLISRTLAGRFDGASWNPALGGVDRSTLALIESSPLIGTVRPTIAYFGATDGMLHAVCADVVGACQYKGQELWAFMPRTMLPNVRNNTVRIDGSPKVADMFGDFNNDGNREWKTVLTFQTGHGQVGFIDKAPAVFALDITDPASPQILWEYTAPAVRGTSELGVGLGLAMGPVRIGSDIKNAVYVQTNNGGTGAPGIYLTAIEIETGTPLWTFTKDYPAARLGSNPPVPATGIPGGVAAFDRTNAGTWTHLLVPSLYGELWMVDTATGQSTFGPNPLFTFSTDYHPIGAPPTVYIDRSTGRLHGLVVSGGYADPIGSSWAPVSEAQYAVAFDLDPSVTPIKDTGIYADRAFVINLGIGNRASAQAVVAGNEIYIVTDNSDVNAADYGLAGNSGTLSRYSLSGGTAITAGVSIPGGGSSVDVANGVVHSGSGKAAQKNDYSATFDADGESTELKYKTEVGRRLWLRLR